MDNDNHNDSVRDKWERMKDKVKAQWDKLTDDDLDHISGRRDALTGRIETRHGIALDEADTQVREFERKNPDFMFEKS